MSRSFRPHNKSTLWDEYYEHYDNSKELKFFNKKHKKAFCKRCIEDAMAQLEASPEARTNFEASDFQDGWDEWKFRQAFERVDPISGRSSNMQRHIKTCVHISPQERTQIMAEFEASQGRPRAQAPTIGPTAGPSSAASSSGEATRTTREDAEDAEEDEEEEEASRGAGSAVDPIGTPTAGIPPASERAVSAEEETLISEEVDDSSTSSSVASQTPTASLPPPQEGSPMQLDTSSASRSQFHARLNTQRPERRSSKFSLRDILNEPHEASESESSAGKAASGSGVVVGTSASKKGRGPPAPTGSSSSSPRFGTTSGFGYTAASSDPDELIARLDNAIRELSLVRQSLSGSSFFSTPNHQPSESQSQSDTSALVAYLRADLESVRRENDTLKSQFTMTKEQNAVLESKLEKYKQRLHDELSDLELDPPGVIGEGGGRDGGGARRISSSSGDISMTGTGRAHSAPALFSPSNTVPGKKRKLGGETHSTGGAD